MSVRVGQGLDAHPFSADADRRLVLGGVRVPNEPGLEGHSDADVVLHAIVDALLGGAGQGDIGTLFGSADPEYSGADSQVFLAGALQRISEAGWRVENVDVTIIAETLRVGPHRDVMRGSLARLLGVAQDAVSVKATSTDGMGFTGRAEGVACLAVALLTRQ
ncbi:MAG: 2-C-methyl-D-erythritol 2,4-cyclodiphosphate synthase [Egibacteraceae bacterium]